MVATMTRDELVDKLDHSEPLAVVDIREKEDYEEWRIAGSRNIPVYNEVLDGNLETLRQRAQDLPRDRTLVMVCVGGYASEEAAAELAEMGFRVCNLEGGMRDWSRAWNIVSLDGDLPGGEVLQVRRIGKGCLSYVLASAGEAAVVDPCLQPGAYEQLVDAHGAELRWVLDTHIHADHVSRGRQLASATGAAYIVPATDRTSFAVRTVGDGDVLTLGSLSIDMLHTPGHTAESICCLVEDSVLLTGDTLFIDSVGRPDLEAGDDGARDGAAALYDSLHETILTLDDDILAAPGHHSEAIGFGGRPVARTLREIRQQVDLLALERNDFIERIVTSLSAKPNSFETIMGINEGRAAPPQSDEAMLRLEAGPNRCAASG